MFSSGGGSTGGYWKQSYYALNLATSELVRLFDPGGGLNLSPDGRYISFSRMPPSIEGEWLATLEFVEPPSPTP
jgi:hypothetical protein